MPFVAVPNGAKVEHLATIYDRPIATVMGGITAGGLEQADVDAVAGFYATAWQTHMVSFAQAPYHYIGCRVTLLDAADGLQGYNEVNVNGVGGSDVNMPPSLAACISLRTGTRSRRGRGRLFWPIITHDAIWEAQTYTLTNVYTGNLRTAFQNFLTSVGELDVQPAVVSRADHLARAITTFSIDNRVDHQRRRDG